MEALTYSKPASGAIQWKQMWSLAALYGSIVIGWIAYQNYQPRLLVQFQFTDFAFLLAVAEAIILVITPPLAGRLGDKYRIKKGHRIPVITAGISFASMIFMAVAFTLLGNPGEVFKWILPFLIVCWLIAMSIFTSPALSTMELFSPVDKLPRAMAILTIVANLIYSLEPVIVDIIDFLGAPITFMTGGTVVFISGLALRKNSLGMFKASDNKEESGAAAIQENVKSKPGLIFVTGVALGFATTVMFNMFPDLLQEKISPLFIVNGKILLVAILVLSAMVSWPVSSLVNRKGLANSFRISFGLVLLSMISIFVFSAPVIVLLATVLFSLSFTALSVSSLPLALQNANHYEKVFCVGVFFSGVALPDGIMNVVRLMG